MIEKETQYLLKIVKIIMALKLTFIPYQNKYIHDQHCGKICLLKVCCMQEMLPGNAVSYNRYKIMYDLLTGANHLADS